MARPSLILCTALLSIAAASAAAPPIVVTWAEGASAVESAQQDFAVAHNLFVRYQHRKQCLSLDQAKMIVTTACRSSK